MSNEICKILQVMFYFEKDLHYTCKGGGIKIAIFCPQWEPVKHTNMI